MKITFKSGTSKPKMCRVDELKPGIFGKDQYCDSYYLYMAKYSQVMIFDLAHNFVTSEEISFCAHNLCYPQPAGSSFKIEG